MIIAVDFDGTIVEHKCPRIGRLVPDAIHWLKLWHSLGADLVLWTCREDSLEEGPLLAEAVAYLQGKGVVLFNVNENSPSWQSRKAYAQLYIDDRGFNMPLYLPPGFDRPVVNWGIVGPAVVKMLKAKS